MNPLDAMIDIPRNFVRKLMHILAVNINKLSGGRVSPNSITIIGLLAHIPIALLIATRHNIWAAGLLVIFGLFDALDGQLARLQHKTSNSGMLLDASTDRFKEVLIYCGVAYAIIASQTNPVVAVWAVAACGASLCVSYIKAKGETAIKGSSLSPNEINRLFADGLLRFEIRMFLIVIGLLTNRLLVAVIIVAILSSLTAIGRLTRIISKLNETDA